MFSQIDNSKPLPISLYKDKVLWLQITYSAIFFTASGIWITAIPRHIKLNLGFDEFVVGLAALVFSLAAVSSRPFVNYLGARRNRHELMFVALLLMLGGSTVAIISNNIYGVLISRAFVGVADGLFYVAISTLVVANAGEKFRGRALNLYSVSLYLGITIGPIIGEQLYQLNKNWSYTLSGMACVTIALFQLGILKFIPSRYKEHIESSKKHSAFCPPVMFPGIIFILGVVAWVGFEQFAPLYGKSLGVDNVSSIFALIGVSVIITRILGSTIIDSMNNKMIIMIALASSLVASICFSQLNGEVAIYLGAFFIAISLGFYYPGFILAAMRRGEKYNSGSVLGTMGMFFDLSFGILPPILGLVAANRSYSSMFAISSILIIAAMVLTFFLKIPNGKFKIDQGQAHSDVVI